MNLHKCWSELVNKSNKLQDHANRRNAGEEISLENKLKQFEAQKKVSERNLDMEIKYVIDKQRRLGHRTFCLPQELDLVPAPGTPLKKRILRAGKIDRVDLEVDTRSVMSDQPRAKRARINSAASTDYDLARYNTMEVLAPETTVMNVISSEMTRPRGVITKPRNGVISEFVENQETYKQEINIQR
ncbi:uncharacterized protein LOC134819927 isoform X1 [Bolinopsis microptera]|uniref:uncharacterized protein LOC134819927 isoform X1 n=1 Tax=Bolinopsis microptera TaxID=2820187 RepID=UPI003079E681